MVVPNTPEANLVTSGVNELVLGLGELDLDRLKSALQAVPAEAQQPDYTTSHARRRVHTVLSSRDTTQLLARYQAGESVSGLCQAFGIHRSTLNRLRRRAGVASRR